MSFGARKVDIIRTLKVSLSNPYGVETIRPECAWSRMFADLLRQKTLTRENVELLKKLGYEFEIVVPAGTKEKL